MRTLTSPAQRPVRRAPPRTRTRVGLLLVTLVAGFAVAPATAATWSEGPGFSAAVSNLAGVATDGTGTSHILWAQETTDAHFLMTRQFDPHGGPQPSRMVAAASVATIAATTDGALIAGVQPSGGRQLMIARVRAGSAPGPAIAVGDNASERVVPTIAVRPDGSGYVTWGRDNPDVGEPDLMVRAFDAALTLAPPVDVGTIPRLSLLTQAPAALTADGRLRVAWPATTTGGGCCVVRVARFTPAGTLDGVEEQPTGAELVASPVVTARGNDAAISWSALGNDGTVEVLAARMPATGAVIGPAASLSRTPRGPASTLHKAITLAADGAATVVYAATNAGLADSASLSLRRIAADGTVGPPVPVSGVSQDREASVVPALLPTADGTQTLVWWTSSDGPPSSSSMRHRTIASDGSLGPTADVPGSRSTIAGTLLLLGPLGAGDGRGNGVVGWADYRDGTIALRIALLQPDPPQTGEVVEPVIPLPPGGGVVQLPAAGGLVQPPAAPDPTPRKSAGLKIRSVRRTAAGRVTVVGRVATTTTGRVSVRWTQKQGRKTVTRRATARIAKGRFTATLRLPKSLARARTSGRLTVAYAASTTTLKASVTRTVKAPKATSTKR